jgi:hypothetical protein
MNLNGVVIYSCSFSFSVICSVCIGYKEKLVFVLSLQAKEKLLVRFITIQQPGWLFSYQQLWLLFQTMIT